MKKYIKAKKQARANKLKNKEPETWLEKAEKWYGRADTTYTLIDMTLTSIEKEEASRLRNEYQGYEQTYEQE